MEGLLSTGTTLSSFLSTTFHRKSLGQRPKLSAGAKRRSASQAVPSSVKELNKPASSSNQLTFSSLSVEEQHPHGEGADAARRLGPGGPDAQEDLTLRGPRALLRPFNRAQHPNTRATISPVLRPGPLSPVLTAGPLSPVPTAGPLS